MRERAVAQFIADIGHRALNARFVRVADVRDRSVIYLADATNNAAKENQRHTLVDDAARMLTDMEPLGTHMSL